MQYQTNTTYHRQLGKGGFLGVDFSSAPYQTDTRRLAECVNLWHDWHSDMGGFLETFPGVRCLVNLHKPIFGLFLFQPINALSPFLIIHAGTSLYALKKEEDMNQSKPIHIGDGLREAESAAFMLQGEMGILDGTVLRLLKYEGDGGGFSLSLAQNLYTPITYADNKPYEQQNVLSDYFMELWHLPYTDGYGEGDTDYLLFEVSSASEKTCRLIGVKQKTTLVRVPSIAHIDGQAYRVTEIGERAFQNNNTIETLVVEEGVESIGRYAVNTCLSLTRVSLPSTLAHIQKAAFAYCEVLEEVHLGEGVAFIDDHAFYRCPALKTVSYSGSQDEFNLITIGQSNEALTGVSIAFQTATKIYARHYQLTVHERCNQLIGLTVNGSPVPEGEFHLTEHTHFQSGTTYYTALGNRYVRATVTVGDMIPANLYFERSQLWFEAKRETVLEEELIVSIHLLATDGRALPQSQCVLEGVLAHTVFAQDSNGTQTAMSSALLKNAIHSSTLCQAFDGRIFVCGSSVLPDTVFYTQRTREGQMHPAYFGISNYIKDGTDNVGFSAICATPTSLFLFKKENATEGMVYCHTPKDTGDSLIPRIYPATAGVVGDGAVGGACHFADDTVFLSKKGLQAVEKSTLSSERGVSHRSFLVDTRLCEENVSKSKMVEWQGYLLLICPGGHIYMADSRLLCRSKTGEAGYEWVYLESMGGYTEDVPVYRFATCFPNGATSCLLGEREVLLSPTPDLLPFDSYEAYEAQYKSILSASLTFFGDNLDTFSEMGSVVEIEDKLYLLYPTDERTGGNFHPATRGCAMGDLLFLGTAAGHLLICNTDMRGKAYEKATPPTEGNIDRHFYHVCHHPIKSLAVTVADNCDCPTLTKSTIKKGTVIDTKSIPGGRVTVAIATDTEDFRPIGVYTEGQMDFEDADLFSFVFSDRKRGQAVFSENTKRWAYKQYALYSMDYQRPFGIGQLSYRYRLQGRMKPQ